jgi:hypothetical protein
MIRAKHSGHKEQIEMILPLLYAALNSSEKNTDKVLTELETKVSLLPTETGNIKISPDYRMGRRQVKQDIDKSFKKMKDKKKDPGDFDHKQALRELIASYEKYLAKL